MIDQRLKSTILKAVEKRKALDAAREALAKSGKEVEKADDAFRASLSELVEAARAGGKQPDKRAVVLNGKCYVIRALDSSCPLEEITLETEGTS